LKIIVFKVMTNEEKQAIIDKAKELNFREYIGSHCVYSNYVNNDLFLNTDDFYISIGINLTNSATIKQITSPEDLETLFNAITK